jgi:hypothetical protein
VKNKVIRPLGWPKIVGPGYKSIGAAPRFFSNLFSNISDFKM